VNAYKHGDHALVEATICEAGDGYVCVELNDAQHAVVALSAIHPAPEPPEPELRRGMVVAADDPTDDRQWWVAEGDAAVRFVDADGAWFTRDELDCARLRVVHPQVTS
jgi:hypothetical protein